MDTLNGIQTNTVVYLTNRVQYVGNVMILLITVSHMNTCDLTVFTQRNLFEQKMCKYGGYLNSLLITVGHMASCN